MEIDEQPKMAEDKQSGEKHAEEKKSHLGIKIVIGIIAVIIIALIVAVLWYNMSLSGAGSENESVEFEIAMGSGTDSIANTLKEKDVIKSPLAFKIYVKLNNISNFKAGKYTITKDMTVPEIAETLQTGKVFKDSYNITFVEGQNFRYIAKTIADNTNNTEQDVYDLLKNEEYLDSLIGEYWFITEDIKNKDIYYSLEGYLFPDTYSFDNKGVTVKEIFKVMLDKMEEILNNYRTDIQASKYNMHQILTLASIIENEAIFDKDRKDISSVLYNRLNANMSLGCDVTTYYGSKIDLGTRDLYTNEINDSNPYNTRGPNMQGKLPVGPISMVGKAALEAAIKPNNTDYLFFVADKAGNVYFTKTVEEHEAKAREIRENGDWIF